MGDNSVNLPEQIEEGEVKIGWSRLRLRILERDGQRCRNCGSEKSLEAHHWGPIAKESEGISRWGYPKNRGQRTVPESALVTLCQICHNALTQARKIRQVADKPELLGSVTVPMRDRHNIFELWELNGRKLPIKVVRQSWYGAAGQFMLVEKIEIRKWPYGLAWGRYHQGGGPKDEKHEKISCAGSYQWKLMM